MAGTTVPPSVRCVPEPSEAERALSASLENLKRAVALAPKHNLPKVASSQDAKELESQCLQCGFWTPDYTKLKSHVRKVHTQLWDTLQDQVAKTCGSFSAHTPKGISVPFAECRFTTETSTVAVPCNVSNRPGVAHAATNCTPRSHMCGAATGVDSASVSGSCSQT